MFIILQILSACFIFSVGAKKLPEFIIPCRNDSELNACALKNARYAIPSLVKGYKPYNLPNLSPLDIPKIDISAGSNLNIELTNNKVYGLENTWISDVDMQVEKQHMVFRVTIPIAGIVGHYKMDGQILILPIKGEGPANVTLVNGDYIYSMDYVLMPKGGQDYLKITNHSITFTTTRAYYHFENLFNGDSNLNVQMNKFLDENWKDVTKDLGATVAETISSIITSIAQNIFMQVPYKEVFKHD